MRRSGCPRKGQIFGSKGPNFWPNQNETESPRTAPTIPAITDEMGSRIPADISAPAAMRMVVPGNTRLRKTNDSPERRKPDNEHRLSRIGFDEGKDLSSKIIHRTSV